jgi:hypothetical protein
LAFLPFSLTSPITYLGTSKKSRPKGAKKTDKFNALTFDYTAIVVQIKIDYNGRCRMPFAHAEYSLPPPFISDLPSLSDPFTEYPLTVVR